MVALAVKQPAERRFVKTAHVKVGVEMSLAARTGTQAGREILTVRHGNQHVFPCDPRELAEGARKHGDRQVFEHLHGARHVKRPIAKRQRIDSGPAPRGFDVSQRRRAAIDPGDAIKSPGVRIAETVHEHAVTAPDIHERLRIGWNEGRHLPESITIFLGEPPFVPDLRQLVGLLLEGHVRDRSGRGQITSANRRSTRLKYHRPITRHAAVTAVETASNPGSSDVRPPRMLHLNPSMMPTSGFRP